MWTRASRVLEKWGARGFLGSGRKSGGRRRASNCAPRATARGKRRRRSAVLVVTEAPGHSPMVVSSPLSFRAPRAYSCSSARSIVSAPRQRRGCGEPHAGVRAGRRRNVAVARAASRRDPACAGHHLPNSFLVPAGPTPAPPVGGGSMKSKLMRSLMPSDLSISTTFPRFVRWISGTWPVEARGGWEEGVFTTAQVTGSATPPRRRGLKRGGEGDQTGPVSHGPPSPPSITQPAHRGFFELVLVGPGRVQAVALAR